MPKHKKETHFTVEHGKKHSQLMKFGQFISYYKRKNVIKIYCKNCNLKTSLRLSLKRIAQLLIFYWKMKLLKQAI